MAKINLEELEQTVKTLKNYIDQQINTSINSIKVPTSLPANGGNSETVSGYSIWSGTQTEYDSLDSKEQTTIYLIKES